MVPTEVEKRQSIGTTLAEGQAGSIGSPIHDKKRQADLRDSIARLHAGFRDSSARLSFHTILSFQG